MNSVAPRTLRDLADQELRIAQQQHAKALVAVEFRPKHADPQSRGLAWKLDDRLFGGERVAEHVGDAEHSLIADCGGLDVHAPLHADDDRTHP